MGIEPIKSLFSTDFYKSSSYAVGVFLFLKDILKKSAKQENVSFRYYIFLCAEVDRA